MAKHAQQTETEQHPYNKTTQNVQAFINNFTKMKQKIILMLDVNEPKYNIKGYMHTSCNHSLLINITKKITHTLRTYLPI